MPNFAVIVAVTKVDTGLVVTVKVVDELPPGITTDAGVVALTAESAIVAPLGGAAPFKVTVPVTETPPDTELALSVKPDRVAGEIVSTALWLVPSKLPVIVDVIGLACPEVEMVKFATDAPAATVTLDGKVAAIPVEARVTTMPPGPAWPFRFTVPVDEPPPITADGERVSD